MDDRSSAPHGHPGAQVPSLCCCYPLGRRLWQKLRASIVSALRPPGRRRQGGEAHRASKLIPLAVPSCKGCWEMSSVAGQPRDQLMLTSIKERRRPTGPGPSHTHQATHWPACHSRRGRAAHVRGAPAVYTTAGGEHRAGGPTARLLQKATSPKAANNQPTRQQEEQMRQMRWQSSMFAQRNTMESQVGPPRWSSG